MRGPAAQESGLGGLDHAAAVVASISPIVNDRKKYAKYTNVER